MRVPTPPPSTGSESGGVCTEKAHICDNSSGTSNDRVQRRASEMTSPTSGDATSRLNGSAVEPANKDNCAGCATKQKCNVKSKQSKTSKKNKAKKMSRREKKWVKSCFLEATPENVARGWRKTILESNLEETSGSVPRRSARLAARQKRTGHYRAKCKQREAQEKAKQAMDRKRE